jgi:hypothetical protein
MISFWISMVPPKMDRTLKSLGHALFIAPEATRPIAVCSKPAQGRGESCLVDYSTALCADTAGIMSCLLDRLGLGTHRALDRLGRGT